MSFERHEPDYESALGIDYHQHFSGDMRRILMAGEREWLRHAPTEYRWDAGEIWSAVMLPRLTQGRLEPGDYQDLKRFCPKMLQALSRQRVKQTKGETITRILAALDPEG